MKQYGGTRIRATYSTSTSCLEYNPWWLLHEVRFSGEERRHTNSGWWQPLSPELISDPTTNWRPIFIEKGNMCPYGSTLARFRKAGRLLPDNLTFNFSENLSTHNLWGNVFNQAHAIKALETCALRGIYRITWWLSNSVVVCHPVQWGCGEREKGITSFELTKDHLVTAP